MGVEVPGERVRVPVKGGSWSKEKGVRVTA